MDMRTIKKALLQGRIRVTHHAKKRMEKRGYTVTDLMNCIWNGELTKRQVFDNRYCVVVEGSDLDGYPIVLIVGRDDKNPKRLAIVSVFPPLHKKFQRVI